MLKKLLILSCRFLTASAFAMFEPKFQLVAPTKEPFFELPQESIQKIEAHSEELQELRRIAVEVGDKERADSITWCIENFNNIAFGRKTLGGALNGSAWELGDDRLGEGLTRHWQLWPAEIPNLKPWVKDAKHIRVKTIDQSFGYKVQYQQLVILSLLF